MAEIKPYSFESMRNMYSSESEEDDVHESQDERRRGNIIVACMRVFCDRELRIEGNKRKHVYDARRSIKEAVNKISGEYYFCI